jgi:hypothetical protein
MPATGSIPDRFGGRMAASSNPTPPHRNGTPSQQGDRAGTSRVESGIPDNGRTSTRRSTLMDHSSPGPRSCQIPGEMIAPKRRKTVSPTWGSLGKFYLATEITSVAPSPIRALILNGSRPKRSPLGAGGANAGRPNVAGTGLGVGEIFLQRSIIWDGVHKGGQSTLIFNWGRLVGGEVVRIEGERQM